MQSEVASVGGKSRFLRLNVKNQSGLTKEEKEEEEPSGLIVSCLSGARTHAYTHTHTHLLFVPVFLFLLFLPLTRSLSLHLA